VPTDVTTYISLNVSPATLMSPDLADWLARHTGRHIVLELTEHAAVDDYEALQRAVHGVQSQGVLVAVDDLGSGFASLRHVVKLRPDIIKLDRSLVSRIDADVALRDLAAALVQFAASSGCTVIAEGIERPEERATCIEIGVRFGQGYLLGAPAPLGPSLADA